MSNWARKSLAVSAIAAGAVLFVGGTAHASDYTSSDQTAGNICGNVDADNAIVINLVDCDADNDDWGGFGWAGAYDQAYSADRFADRFQDGTDRVAQDRSADRVYQDRVAGQDLMDGTANRNFQDGTDRVAQDRSADRIYQDQAAQDRVGQDRVYQDRVGQDRVGQDRFADRNLMDGADRLAQDRTDRIYG